MNYVLCVFPAGELETACEWFASRGWTALGASTTADALRLLHSSLDAVVWHREPHDEQTPFRKMLDSEELRFVARYVWMCFPEVPGKLAKNLGEAEQHLLEQVPILKAQRTPRRDRSESSCVMLPRINRLCSASPS